MRHLKSGPHSRRGLLVLGLGLGDAHLEGEAASSGSVKSLFHRPIKAASSGSVKGGRHGRPISSATDRTSSDTGLATPTPFISSATDPRGSSFISNSGVVVPVVVVGTTRVATTLRVNCEHVRVNRPNDLAGRTPRVPNLVPKWLRIEKGIMVTGWRAQGPGPRPPPPLPPGRPAGLCPAFAGDIPAGRPQGATWTPKNKRSRRPPGRLPEGREAFPKVGSLAPQFWHGSPHPKAALDRLHTLRGAPDCPHSLTHRGAAPENPGICQTAPPIPRGGKVGNPASRRGHRCPARTQRGCMWLKVRYTLASEAQ